MTFTRPSAFSAGAGGDLPVSASEPPRADLPGDPRSDGTLIVPASEAEAAPPPSPRRLVLASASPRRQSILREAGYDFLVHPANVDEENFPPTLLPSEVAHHLAVIKADAVARQFPDAVVLAADTVVAFGDRLLGKPEDPLAAKRMLELLSGTTHIVITGVCVSHQAAGFKRSTRVMSAVRMRWLSNSEINRYVDSREWQGKAGGYGIQDSDPFVTRLAGSHTNIVGLPITTARDLLAAAGVYPKPRSHGSIDDSIFNGSPPAGPG